jgi:Flp pilus assembly protein TadG
MKASGKTRQRLECRRMQDRSGRNSRSAESAGNRLQCWPGRLSRDEAGASLVEFALIAVPFFVLLYGGFEIGFVYWANQELEHATAYGARLVRTGQAQAEGLGQAQLTTKICSQTAVLVGCTSKLRLDVRSAKTFSEIVPPSPLNGSGVLKDLAEFTFSPGTANDVVLVSAFYNWPPLLKPSGYVLRAATVVRNEPF